MFLAAAQFMGCGIQAVCDFNNVLYTGSNFLKEAGVAELTQVFDGAFHA